MRAGLDADVNGVLGLKPLKQAQAQGIIGSLWNLYMNVMKCQYCTNSNKYATITTFMYLRCERVRLSGYIPQLGDNPGGHTMGP